MPIYFYSTRDAYGCFSNFSAHGITLKGCWWPTTEHYFQAQKFAGTEHEEAIRQAKTPKDAATMGRERNRPLRPDWEQVKDAVMREAVREKFLRHTDIQAILLGTGDALIVENAPGDYYWGIGADGSGKNMLGQILMEVRTQGVLLVRSPAVSLHMPCLHRLCISLPIVIRIKQMGVVFVDAIVV